MSVTRYDLEVSEFSDCYGVEMEESANGDYVTYDDYAKLDAKCDTENYIANTLIRKLEAQRDRLRELVAKAYSEGFDHGVWAADDADDEYTPSSDDWWPESDARKALQEAEG